MKKPKVEGLLQRDRGVRFPKHSFQSWRMNFQLKPGSVFQLFVKPGNF